MESLEKKDTLSPDEKREFLHLAAELAEKMQGIITP